MIVSKVDDITVGDLEPKVNTRQSLPRDVKIIVASNGVIEKYLRVVRLYG
jgi:hypothetical protein